MIPHYNNNVTSEEKSDRLRYREVESLEAIAKSLKKISTLLAGMLGMLGVDDIKSKTLILKDLNSALKEIE